MPTRKTETREGTHQTLKNVAYESIVAGWLMQDGWQVFTPVLDDGHSTDILISDGPNYHRVQIKTLESPTDDTYLENKWHNSNVDVVICFARNSNWGYVIPAFEEDRRKLNSAGHQRFNENRADFLKAFHKV